MPYTMSYYEIREDTSVKFWHETDSVKSWFSEYDKQMLESGKLISIKDTIDADGTIHIREAILENENDYTELLNLSPVQDYQELRRSYNIENNISFFASHG